MNFIRPISSCVKIIVLLIALIADVGLSQCQVIKPTTTGKPKPTTTKKPTTTTKPSPNTHIQTTEHNVGNSSGGKISADVVRISEEAYVSKGIKSANNVAGKTVTQICSETSLESKSNLARAASDLSSSKKYATSRGYDSNGYHYTTDEQGRIVKVEGKIEIPENKKPRPNLPELEDMKDTDHKGHLIAHEFGGADDIGNLVPMDAELNSKGEYRKFEIEIEKLKKKGKEVNVNIECNYEDASNRPSSFTVSYEVDGEITERTFLNE